MSGAGRWRECGAANDVKRQVSRGSVGTAVAEESVVASRSKLRIHGAMSKDSESKKETHVPNYIHELVEIRYGGTLRYVGLAVTRVGSATKHCKWETAPRNASHSTNLQMSGLRVPVRD